MGGFEEEEGAGRGVAYGRGGEVALLDMVKIKNPQKTQQEGERNEPQRRW